MPTHPGIWQILEDRFRADQWDELVRADYYSSASLGDSWRLVPGADAETWKRFEGCAFRAGDELNLPEVTTKNPTWHWFNALRIEGLGFELNAPPADQLIEVRSDRSEDIAVVGSLYRVIENSAILCERLHRRGPLAATIAAGQSISRPGRPPNRHRKEMIRLALGTVSPAWRDDPDDLAEKLDDWDVKAPKGHRNWLAYSVTVGKRRFRELIGSLIR